MSELLCCKPHLPCGRGHTDMHDTQTQTDSYNANMPHFTHVRANAHKHTVSPPRPTHAYLYNLSQQALLLLKPTEPQTY